MCGLCGLVGPLGRAAPERIEPMARTLRHRGPDDFGSWTRRFHDGGEEQVVALGHTRLSILDLSPLGHQPMLSPDGRFAVTYNGELYNFRAVREELRALGSAFRSECDTEVLLEAWRRWGLAAIDRFVGMFAFALWDEREHKLVLARDRLGIKPLYYALLDDGLLLFGSELHALRAHPRFRAEIDRASLAGYLQHGHVAGPETIYAGVRQLAPGGYLVWQRGRIELGSYWRLTDPGEPPPTGFEAAVDRLETLLGDAVELRLVADVPLGAFLSGGIDSSAVVALMRERASGAVRTFSIGFSEAAYDEAPHARAVADVLGTEHVELYVGRKAAVDVARELPDLYDEPFGDASAIPTVLLSRLTRQYVTVALSGDGGDELFGGYDQYPKLHRLLPWLRTPRALRAAAAALGAVAPLPFSLRRALRHLDADGPRDVAESLLRFYDPRDLLAACGPGSVRARAAYREAFDAAPQPEPERRAMLADARTYLPDDILTKVDRASMSVALEARVPILDHRVVRFASSLPLAILWHGGVRKAPLREIAYRRIPRALLDRPKHGFGIPIESLLTRELEAWSRRYLAPERLREEGLLDPDGVRHLVAAAQRHPVGVSQLWSLLCFERWFARHHRGEGLD
jgi:asparagine synthase (glutamine-hydrolysing)